MKSKASKIYIILIAVLVIAIAALLIWKAVSADNVSTAAPEPSPAQPTAEVIIQEKEVEKIVEVEKEISSEVISDGLNDMGTLITEEYYFTDAISFTSVKQIFNINLGITETSYLGTYDGVVTAGIDFSEISVIKDDDNLKIFVTVPEASIINIDIDPESFQLFSEKSGVGNPVSVEDFNTSLVELEDTVSAKAIERGILDRANENAEKLIRNFIGSLADLDIYTITVDFE